VQNKTTTPATILKTTLTKTLTKTLTLALLTALSTTTLPACVNALPGEDDELTESADFVNPSGDSEQALTMPSCGTSLAWFDGTDARSNAGYTGTGTGCAGQGGIAGGLQYQCVELVMRHFKRKWNLRWYGNAKDLLRNAPRDTVDVIDNGDRAHPPVPGDLIVWETGSWGHTALVTAVTSTYVDIIEQNVNGNGKARLPFSNGRIGSRWSGWVPTGWAHAKVNRAGASTSGSTGSTGGSTGGTSGGCGTVGENGGVIDDDDACFSLGGTASYLHAETTQGYASDLVWTHTTNDASVDNSATWALNLARAGTYRVEAFVDHDVADAKQAKYRVRHAGTNTDVVVDQSTSSTWRRLGEFNFARGAGQKVFLGDATGEAGSLRRKLVFDAVRITPVCATLKVTTDNDAPLNVRAAPNRDAQRLGELESGSTAERVNTVDGGAVEGNTVWHEVRQGGVRGFVAGAYMACP
jgi:hypothetical protein